MLLPILLTAFAVPLQDDEPEIVQLATAWEVGDKLKIEMTRQRAEFENGQRTSAGGTRADVELEVLEASDDGFVFRWSVGSIRLEEDPWDDQGPLPALVAMAENVVLELVTDEFGTPTAVRNLAAVRKRYDAAFEATLDQLVEKGMKADERERVTQLLAATMTDEFVERAALNEPRMLFLAAGGEYALRRRQAYEDFLPNPLGGEPFPSTAFFRLEIATPSNAVVQWRQQLDPERSTEILFTSLKAAAERAGTPLPERDELPKLQIADQAQYIFDRPTGWPAELTWQRRTVIGTRGRIDSLRFEAEPVR